MKRINIYTAGNMKSISKSEAMNWRLDVQYKLLKLLTDSDIDVRFYHPPLFYNYEDQNHRTEREVKEWEINHLKDSNIMIVNLENVNESVGTHYELATADASNQSGGNYIYVIGFGNPDQVHPWILESLFRIEPNIESAVRYIADYLIY